MIEDNAPAQNPGFADGRRRDRVTIDGDDFLNAVIDTVAGDDAEKRAWARAMVEQENIAASFVVNVRWALRAVREARGLSMEAAAEQAGVSTSALSRLETGATAKADLKLVARVALLLGVVPRLDFAPRGTAADVSVGGVVSPRPQAAGFRDRDQPPLTAPPVSLAPDPTALDRRIRDLEARIAAMEPPKPENGD